MTLFPEELLAKLEKNQVVAGFSVEKIEHAVPLAKALLAGGIDVIELTLRTAVGLEAVRVICEQVPEMIVGVGTILTPDQVRDVKAAGAHFGVSPGMNPKVVQAAQEAGLPFAPGIATPSELEIAIALGCRFVKFFPAEATGGIKYLNSIAAPFKHLGIRYFPLGGLNAENMVAYLNQEIVSAIGGSWIVKSDLVNSKNWTEISQRAASVKQALAEAGKE